ncbi:MAG: hypothetical protein A4E20_02375 [Nitrospira sp. SG-bin2]|jgi:hypothetical protein|nr:MAG: hypothetical protein A4E20_02375 [Nitrospira sp. SG-bin2]
MLNYAMIARAVTLPVLASAMLAGCGGGDTVPAGTGGTAGVAAAGIVQAPAGALARAATEKSWFASLFSVAESWAIDITGWTGVSGATVRVFTIDDHGVPIGSVIATGSTNPDGSFNLTLPTGTVFASNLIAQVEDALAITGPMPVGTANTLSVFIVSSTINLNPATDVATKALVDRGGEPLSNYTPEEVAQYLAVVETLVTENPPASANLATTLTQIAAAVGGQITAVLNALSGTGVADPVIITTSLPNGVQNSPYSRTALAVGGTGALTWSLHDGALPLGLSLNQSTGRISGTPTTPVSQSSVILMVRDAASPTPRTDTQALSLTIEPLAPPSVTTASPLPDGQVGSAYNTTLTATGGTPGYVWSYAVGSNQLPSGLSLNPSGVISGTPNSAGTVQITVQVTDNAGLSATGVLSITVTSVAQPLSITTTAADPLPAGVVGQPYAGPTIQAAGGTPPYTWSIEPTPHPYGFVIGSGTGVLSGGVSQSEASIAVTVVVRDSSNPIQQDERRFSVYFGAPCNRGNGELTITNAPPQFGGRFCPTGSFIPTEATLEVGISFTEVEVIPNYVLSENVLVTVDNATGVLRSASIGRNDQFGIYGWSCSMEDFSQPACNGITVLPQSGVIDFREATFTYRGHPYAGQVITLTGQLIFPAFTLPLQPPPP